MREPWPAATLARMHSEYVDGLTLRPLMDAGWTAWLDGERVGTVRFVDGAVVVRAAAPRVRRVLVERLAADLRAAGLAAPRVEECGSSSQARPERSGGSSFRFSSPPDTKSAA
jgi:hypothetical protein